MTTSVTSSPDTITMKLTSPLFTSWDPQHVKLVVPGLKRGAAVSLSIDGKPASFQYTGIEVAKVPGEPASAEVLVRLGFAKGQTKVLEFAAADQAVGDLSRVQLPLEAAARIGIAGREIQIPANHTDQGAAGAVPGIPGVPGPFGGFGGTPLTSTVYCGTPLLSRRLFRINDGPLFTEYELDYRFAENRNYAIRFRCFRDDRIVEVSEKFSLGMDSELEWALNPNAIYDSILSRESFEGENQPDIEPINKERPRDVLCRLQMPVLTEYFIPNNRGWFAFFDSKNESREMFGVLGLHGAKWVNPVENIMKVSVAGGKAVMKTSLRSGERHWLLYTGPLQKTFTRENRLVFHRLFAEFSALRLDEHLDLTGTEILDSQCWNKPGIFGDNYRETVRRNTPRIPLLQKAAANKTFVIMQALLDPKPEYIDSIRSELMARFEKWVVQFQGFREGKHDYAKNVIGFARRLRHELLRYEFLRKEGALGEEQVRQLHAYFVFAARRILDEGRWPHSKSWVHPDHPESTRDTYAYPGEHKPDRLVWTNCLPNFQSDPMCALLHLSATIPDHPDAAMWQRFSLDDIERQLDGYCSSSGAWEESPIYVIHTLSYFIASFRILKNRTGINYFQDERVRRLVGWLVRFFGPNDKRFNAYTFPGVGNSSVPGLDGGLLLAYAGELEEGDPLRDDLISVSQKMAKDQHAGDENYFLLTAAFAPVVDREYPLRPLASEVMADLGVAMRHGHPSPTESYLFQKIGFYKDHYEADETAFNWYAKGTPLCMEYGTYTPPAGAGGAHNIIDIPDADSLRRGYMAESYFTPHVDFTRSEVPVTLKLLHGRLRTFAEIDGPPTPGKFFYLGDENPLGPKVWKVRLLMFVKPDYLVLFDRVFGAVPHRYNLHITGDNIRRDGAVIQATGRFDLDPLCFVQHPETFEIETGELAPGRRAEGDTTPDPHRQSFFRLYNKADNTYRTLIFARERDRAVTVERVGNHGIKVVTPEYTDYAFVSDEPIHDGDKTVRFTGRSGWIRRNKDGQVTATMVNGDAIEAFGVKLSGRGPWHYNIDGKGKVVVQGTPRPVTVAKQ